MWLEWSLIVLPVNGGSGRCREANRNMQFLTLSYSQLPPSVYTRQINPWWIVLGRTGDLHRTHHCPADIALTRSLGTVIKLNVYLLKRARIPEPNAKPVNVASCEPVDVQFTRKPIHHGQLSPILVLKTYRVG